MNLIHSPWRRPLSRASSRRRYVLAAWVLAALVVPGAATPLHGAQDPLAGWWSASVQDAGRSPEVVFVLQVAGERISGRRLVPGQDPVAVSGERTADTVRIHFQIQEGDGQIPVAIVAVLGEDQLLGRWRVTLPTGQVVERRWLAVRTRPGQDR